LLLSWWITYSYSNFYSIPFAFSVSIPFAFSFAFPNTYFFFRGLFFGGIFF
jgi:hypothetical protein